MRVTASVCHLLFFDCENYITSKSWFSNRPNRADPQFFMAMAVCSCVFVSFLELCVFLCLFVLSRRIELSRFCQGAIELYRENLRWTSSIKHEQAPRHHLPRRHLRTPRCRQCNFRINFRNNFRISYRGLLLVPQQTIHELPSKAVRRQVL